MALAFLLDLLQAEMDDAACGRDATVEDGSAAHGGATGAGTGSGEGDAAKPLGEIQKAFPEVVIGSYPFQAPDGFATNLVLRSRDAAKLDEALAAVRAMAALLTAEGKARGWS